MTTIHRAPRIGYDDAEDADVCLRCPLDECYPDSPLCPIYGEQVIAQLARNIWIRDMQRALRGCRIQP